MFAPNVFMTIQYMEPALRHGLTLIESGRYEPAHAEAIKLIHQDIGNPVPYFLLGRIALDHHNYAKAGELLCRARELCPQDPFYLAALGQFQVTVGQQEQALQSANEAASLTIDEAFAADMVGVIYSRTGFHEKAVPFFEQAVALNPEPANFHYNLGASLQFSGQFSRAEQAYRQAIARQPDNYRAYSSLVGLSRQTPENQMLDRLESLFEAHAGNPDAALHFGHAIAKTLEDLDRYPESFDWLVNAKRSKREALAYDVKNDLELFDAAAKTVDQSGIRADDEDSPIFIIGLPRTGTTLVDRILSSHPDVISAGELNTFAGLVKTQAGTESNRVLDPPTLSRATRADAGALVQLGRDYVSRTRTLARGAPRFTDKMPLNFFYAGLIQRALPSARIIALRRDPLDSCLSNFRQLFSTGFSYYNYSLDILDTGRYYQAFDHLLAHWRTQLPAESFMEVRYEDVVRDQESQTRSLLAFCDLDWNDACLHFQDNPSPVSTASSVQVRQPIYATSIGRWKRYGDRLDSLRRLLDPQDSISSSGT